MEQREPEEIAELPRESEPARDGIGEEDHAIPFWFTASFVATIVFALVYVPWYTGSGWSQVSQYGEESERLESRFAAVRASLPKANPYRGNAQAIAEGRETFTTICVACHLADGRGLVGPSLVDPYWKYGHDDEVLFETVAKGRPAGMPPWETQLGAERIWKVLAYIETLPRSDGPGVGAPGYAPPAPAPGG
jgi:cytochrome c oxidase cbb3-type subunit 3